MELKKKISPCLYVVSIILILIYPLRHICRGVDVWDGGYNYANAFFCDLDYMDSMWYFATWIANKIGNLFTKLPGGETMSGMNVYTGLLVGAIGMGAYIFCTKQLRMPAWLAFVGEIVALSLCWVPSSALYNYLTYGLLLIGTVCLYRGLMTGKQWYLALAGIALGLNVGVRFSNLVQASLILVVWYEAFLSKKKWKDVLRETGMCMLGYLGAYGGFLSLISLQYGFSSYIEGIKQLFAMTGTATDYRALSMLEGMLGAYIAPESTYWMKRIGLAGVVAMIICLTLPKKWQRVKQVLTVIVLVVLGGYLLQNDYCTGNFRNYDSIYNHCVILFFMAIVLSVYNMCSRDVEREEKIQAMFVIMVLCLTSLGGNNAMYASINNLFFVLPCILWMVYRFAKRRKHIVYFPFQTFLSGAVLLLVVQGLQFGFVFVYEGTIGGWDFSYEIEKVPVLRGIHTNPESGRQLEELYIYLQENDLSDRECILYGNIPGISYYMELVPAMNIWSDLRSYVPERMLEDLQKVEAEILAGSEKPVVILEKNYMEYWETGNTEGILLDDETTLEKFHYFAGFMKQYGYEKSYAGDKYIVYQ